MNYYNEIKTKLIENENYARIKEYSKERYKLNTYYEVGKILSEAGKHYGENIIRKYSIKLQEEVGKKYNRRILFRMRQFYLMFQNEKVSTLSTQLSWSHYVELLGIENIQQLKYYMNVIISQCLSVRELRNKIKNNEYERLEESARLKLIKQEELTIQDSIKNPIVLQPQKNIPNLTEKDLQNIILENIEAFLKEPGQSFCFIGSEYKIKIGARFNYIDLLLFNIEYNCYVVIELKVTELKKEHIGQIETYMNYIDKNLKKITQDKTIGIIICKKDNQFLMEYCSDPRILSREYKISGGK